MYIIYSLHIIRVDPADTIMRIPIIIYCQHGSRRCARIHMRFRFTYKTLKGLTSVVSPGGSGVLPFAAHNIIYNETAFRTYYYASSRPNESVILLLLLCADACYIKQSCAMASILYRYLSTYYIPIHAHIPRTQRHITIIYI